MERFGDRIVYNNIMLYSMSDLISGDIYKNNGKILDNICTKCTSKETFNSYTLDAEFIVKRTNGEIDWRDTPNIQINKILKVRTDYYIPEVQNSNYELFIITKVVRDWDKYTITARQVMFEICNAGYIDDCRPTGTCQYALEQLYHTASVGGLEYIDCSLVSDIQDVNTSYYINKTLEDCISGTDNSISNVWNAEIIRRGTTLQALKHIGNDTNIEIREGKNVTVYEESENNDNLYYAIVPIGKVNNNTNLYGSRVLYSDYQYNREYILPKLLIKEYPVMLIVEEEKTERDPQTYYYTNKDKALAKLEELAQADVEETSVLKREFRVMYNYNINNNLQLGDTCKLIMESQFVDTKVRVMEREFDHLEQKITSLEVSEVI